MIHTWANIALIFLILLSMIAWMIPLALLFFSVKGMQKARQRMGSLMPQAQERVRRATSLVERGSRQVARPIIWAYTWAARVQATTRALKGRPTRSSSSITGRSEVNQ